MGQMPLGIATFLLLHLLEKLMSRWRWYWLTRFLRSFRWLLSTFWLFLGNVQYLSFRAFQQMRDVVPPNNSLAYRINLIAAYTTLFFVLVLAISYYAFVLKWSKKGTQTLWNLTRPTTPTLLYAGSLFLMKFVAGAVHALIY